jgi:uncharacterized UBP type Zn finger protein
MTEPAQSQSAVEVGGLPCPHWAEATDVAPPLDVCESCIEIGSDWMHLRQCLICGRTGCCDNSPNRHATAHANSTGHPLIRSAEPGEKWAWCYPDELAFIPGPDGWERVDEE